MTTTASGRWLLDVRPGAGRIEHRDAPVVEEVTITVVADTDAGEDALAEVEHTTRERCPGVYCLTKPIPLRTSVHRA